LLAGRRDFTFAGTGMVGSVPEERKAAMSENVSQVTDATFESSVVNSGKPAMVDFWATWCGPCKMIAPHVEALAAEFAGKAVVAKLDVDSNRQTAIKFGIQSIPTVLFFKDGKLVDRVVGAADKKVLKEKLSALL
jgi:thioredoxin 1